MSNNFKGIVLAGGNGSRLAPLTNCISKQLMPLYDKPMIYYPISTLMLAGITEILIICTSSDLDHFKSLLKDGSQLGLSLSYKTQDKPNGIAEAFIIGQDFIQNDSVCLILGDNIFYGDSISQILSDAIHNNSGATIFAYSVNDPSRYGVAEIGENMKVLSIEEKPKDPKSCYAVTGLYIYNNQVINMAENLTPSARGELEITDLNNTYIQMDTLNSTILGRGFAWLDTGTESSLLEAAQFVQVIEKRQGLKVGCPEEIAWRQGWINDTELLGLAKLLPKTDYGRYLVQIVTS